MRETIVLANASAGRKRGRLAVTRMCVEAGIEIVETHSPEETRQAASQAAAQGCRRVIAAGGDGTVHQAVNALAGSDTALGIVPTGTANDLARAFGIPLRLEPAFRVALTGAPRRIDLGRVQPTGTLFASVATFGVGAEANRLANQLGAGGGFKYSYALLRALLAFEPPTVTVQWDDDEFQEAMMIGLVGNTTSYGGGMRVTPHAVADDGLLDVCLVSRMSRLKLLACFPQVFFGAHLRHPEVLYFRSTRLGVECDRTLDNLADGEFVARTPVDFEIVPSCLSLVTSDK